MLLKAAAGAAGATMKSQDRVVECASDSASLGREGNEALLGWSSRVCLRRQRVGVRLGVRLRLREPHLSAVRCSVESGSLQLLSANDSWKERFPSDF